MKRIYEFIDELANETNFYDKGVANYNTLLLYLENKGYICKGLFFNGYWKLYKIEKINGVLLEDLYFDIDYIIEDVDDYILNNYFLNNIDKNNIEIS